MKFESSYCDKDELNNYIMIVYMFMILCNLSLWFMKFMFT